MKEIQICPTATNDNHRSLFCLKFCNDKIYINISKLILIIFVNCANVIKNISFYMSYYAIYKGAKEIL